MLKRPYGDLEVIKKECVNHLRRNFTGKLLVLRKSKHYDLNLRKMIAKEDGQSEITEKINEVVEYWRVQDSPLQERITNLEVDIKNAPYHVFGRHTGCR